ncbi:flagellar hook protein FlgE [Methylotenera sp.]|uniref:flagellar hook protein FlgE n=1 Tax=Methylotenera sp. TaxID=2051956 RepID=UPI002487DE91|nr:flagellar hook protein FlgE [Methylotenera sp.]MDI1299746.1 flagellar hook protein FlgE [Methylotenera sp.]
MSFQQGLSGLNAASKQLEVIGNNVANANTVGFKQSRAEFADVFANSLTGGGGTQIGIGTNLSTVAQQFTQGNVTSTNNSLDIAINGGGFFRMTNNGAVTYSRNGQFKMDKDGFIVDAASKRLTGYAADAAGTLQKGAPVDLKINTSDLQPQATAKIVGLVNLDSRKAVPTTTPFDPTDPTTYNDSTAVTVFDSLGNSHTLQTYFVKDPSPNVWKVYTTADGISTTTLPTATATMTFPASGTGLNPTSVPASPTTVTFAPKNPPIPPATVPTVATGAANVSLTIDYSGSTQFGSNFSINSLSQDGYTSGRLAGFNTGADGTIVGRYSNGQSRALGQVVLASFANPNGLQSLGGNAWSESSTSGAPLVGVPSSGTLGVLQSSAVEDSNTDLTAELVNMITAQRYYQANAQTIKTQDQVLQTLVNLR